MLLMFQKSQGSICLSDVEMYVEISTHKISQCHNNNKFFKVNNFEDMKKLAAEEMLNLPRSSRLRAPVLFIEAFKEELNNASSQIKFWSNSSIFDPRKFPEDLPSLEAYGHVELDKLLVPYGNRQSNKFDGTTINQEPDVSIAMAKVEWESFKKFMYCKRQKHRYLHYFIKQSKNRRK